MTKWLDIISIFLFVIKVNGHGRLIEPPSRASMWRYGFNTPSNYNDHELYCGGFSRQWLKNGGKCGVCGDPWDIPSPRPHEAGGKYAQGVIVRKYNPGSSITIRVELTANHKGYFEFRLCPHNEPKKVVSQQCLDKYLLKRSKDITQRTGPFHESRYYPSNENKLFQIKYQLPKNVICSQCILQWKYIAGNNWGTCRNGTGAVGCGPQEEFRACSDIAIHHPETNNETEEYQEENYVKSNDNWLFSILISICCFIVAVFIYMLFYFYYYHIGDILKKWCIFIGDKRKNQFETQVPLPPPRTKKVNFVLNEFP